MTPPEWSRVKEIVGDALERPPEERTAWIEEACGGDVDLRRRVESLLAADARDWDLLDAPAAAAAAAVVAAGASQPRLPAPGDRVGPWEILREIGHGGMGAVYLARRADAQFEKTVAIKVSLFGGGEALDRRFRAERQIVAALEHPNMARLLDGGTTPDGRPYFVMEYVEGEPLVAWCDAAPKTVPERLRIFLDVCAAVEAAHARGVIHRDLKPTNILVTREGVVKLLDFGIAKLLEPRELGISREDTGAAFGLMTPDYASPEQLKGEPVTAASDVYALGVILYELLTGRRPHRASPSSQVELARAICEVEAPRASAVAPSSVARLLAGDLDTVLSKALRKEPDRRYASARELAEDIRRFLEGRTVRARPETWSYRGRRFVTRHRAAVAAAVVAALSLGALAVVWIGRRGLDGPAGASVKTAPRTLAVLPFRPLAGAVANPVLELGLADTLITKLSTVPGISVRPTAAVSGFAGSRTDPVELARSLRVDVAVVGSVQESKGRSRVTVRLVRATDGATVWGDVFDAPSTEIFGMEDAIARRVAEALLPGLGPRARIGLSRRDTQSLEAYQEYLKGRYFWSRRTESDFRKAITHFEAAIAADDRYALAYSGLADCWILLGVWGAGPAVETHGRARDAAARAAAFDDAPGELHASNAFVKWVYDWDWDGAEAEFRKAIASSPGYATAHQWYAYFLVCRRRFDEAITEIRRAQQLDPLSVSIATDVGEIHCWAGRPGDAIAHLRAALDLEPNSAQAHNALGMALVAQGRATDALPELEQALALDGSPRMISSLGHGYGAAGRSADARRQEGRLLALSKERYVSPFAFALIHAGLGDVDGAFGFLDRAFEERSDTMAIIEVHPLFAGLRRDARFAALMARVEASRRVGP